MLLLSCGNWDIPSRKSQRECIKPAGTLSTQIQQLKVDFSISGSSGTIDKVNWDFGNNSTTATTGLTVSNTYPASGTYTVKATLTNSCGNETVLQQVISVSNALSPTVTLQPVTDVTTTSAAVRMTLTSTGNATITRYGICYSATNPTPEIGKENVTVIDMPTALPINSPTSFTLTPLLPNTTYYVRSYAINSAVSTPGYSDVQTFRTGQNPVVAVNGTASVGTTTASVNFVVTNPGSPAAVEYGICYSSSSSTPDKNSSTVKVTSPTTGANVVVTLTDLTPNKTYYYRSYAITASGDVIYSDVMTLTTQVDTVSQDLIASVSFTDRSLLDASANNNDVKLVGNPTFVSDRKGKANAAISLNGSGDYFYMPENNSLNPNDLSISIWIKPNVVNDRMLIYNKSKFSDGTNEMYSSLIKPSESGSGIAINVDIKQGSNCKPAAGWQTVTFSSSPDLSKWHHVVFTYSGKSIRMYFDTILLGQTDSLPGSSIDTCPGGDLKFGAQSQALPQYFSGAMDDIRIYKRAITAAEVQTLFNQ
ncbi:hypothetical protein GCM10028810_24360 [Spirosoma litoris]